MQGYLNSDIDENETSNSQKSDSSKKSSKAFNDSLGRRKVSKNVKTKDESSKSIKTDSTVASTKSQKRSISSRSQTGVSETNETVNSNRSKTGISEIVESQEASSAIAKPVPKVHGKEDEVCRSQKIDFQNISLYTADDSANSSKDCSDPFKKKPSKVMFPESAVLGRQDKALSKASQSKQSTVRPMKPNFSISAHKSQRARRSVKKSPDLSPKKEAKPSIVSTPPNIGASILPTESTQCKSSIVIQEGSPQKNEESFWKLIKQKRLKSTRPQFTTYAIIITAGYVIGLITIIALTLYFCFFHNFGD